MCGVFYIDADIFRGIEKDGNPIDKKIKMNTCFGDRHPSDLAPVIIGEEGKMTVRLLRWGFPDSKERGIIFNARSETVKEKRMFQNGIRYHRALIPARHFYEWNRNHEKNVFFRSDKKTIYLAGLCDMAGNEERFVVLTTRANASMIPVHDRMPLILEEDQIERWLFEPEFTDEILMQEPVRLDRQTDYEQMSLF